MKNNLYQRFMTIALLGTMLVACGGGREGKVSADEAELWQVTKELRLKDFNNMERPNVPETCTVSPGSLLRKDSDEPIAAVGDGAEFSEVDAEGNEGDCSGALSDEEFEALQREGVVISLDGIVANSGSLEAEYNPFIPLPEGARK